MRLFAFLVAPCAAFSPPASLLQRPAVRRAAAPAMQMPPAATELLALLGKAPDQIQFQLVMDAIDELYDVREVNFSVGDVVSTPGQNMGSAKILSFATYSKLEPAATLQLFGDYYRKDVLEHPDATDHANIRAFMKVGWDGVKFPDGLAVTPKNLGDYVSYGPSIVDAYNNY